MLSITKRLILNPAYLASFLCLFCGSFCLSALESPTLTRRLEMAQQEFYREKAKNPVFRREWFDINYNIRFNPQFAKNRRTLTVEEAWQGVMEKAWDPIKYIPHAIVKSVILKETIQEDERTSYFVRISIQLPFIEEPSQAKPSILW